MNYYLYKGRIFFIIGDEVNIKVKILSLDIFKKINNPYIFKLKLFKSFKK